MASITKSKEELAIAKLRMNIIKKMEESVIQNEAQHVSLYATALQLLPIPMDYVGEE